MSEAALQYWIEHGPFKPGEKVLVEPYYPARPWKIGTVKGPGHFNQHEGVLSYDIIYDDGTMGNPAPFRMTRLTDLTLDQIVARIPG